VEDRRILQKDDGAERLHAFPQEIVELG